MFGQSDPELNGGELQIEVGDHLHLSVDQILASLDNVQTSINPNDARCAPQSKGSFKSSGNTLGAVIVQDFEVHPVTGKAENNKDPSFGLVTVDMGENRSEDISLTVGERRLNRLEDIGDICFVRHEGYLI